MNATPALADAGQRLWLDTISRHLVESGTLQRYINQYGVTGVTSVLGDGPFHPTAPCGPLRGCTPVACPGHQKIDFANLLGNPASLMMHSAERTPHRRYRLERAVQDTVGIRW
jgi:hypothetical protein